MPAHPRLGVKDVAAALHRSERDIRDLAREALRGSEGADLEVLRNRATSEPITDEDGWAYAIVATPPGGRGRPRIDESNWAFRPVKPPQRSMTLAQRNLLPGCVQGTNHQIITAVAAEAGIVPGAPVRALGKNPSAEATQVIMSNEPGPVVGMLLRPEGTAEGWKSRMGDNLVVLVQGTLLLPSAGPIGIGAIDRLLWDPEVLCWRGEPVKARSLLELQGSWGLDHSSKGVEPAAALIDGIHGLRLDWLPTPIP
jgi:hypothetical protein